MKAYPQTSNGTSKPQDIPAFTLCHVWLTALSPGQCLSALVRFIWFNEVFKQNVQHMTNKHINYVEFKANDLGEIKRFYHQAFGWHFTDYVPTYVSFSDSGLVGGFEKSDERIVNGALVILYCDRLESMQDQVVEAGGKIAKEIFSFPGGRRFHFIDPAGNELAMWSDK